MSDSDSPVTEQTIDHLMGLLGELTPDQFGQMAKLVPDKYKAKAYALLIAAAGVQIETSFHAGSLAAIGAGLQEDGSVQLSAPEVALIVREAVRFLIDQGKE